MLGFAMGAELLSLLLFAQTAKPCPASSSARCALPACWNVNRFGFPTPAAEDCPVFPAALWLLLNRVDNRGYDYPLVRVKWYGLLLAPRPCWRATGRGT
ncbi:MAG: hypothetical protein R3F40_05035 [Candidatus Competibacteraceae bacterium]